MARIRHTIQNRVIPIAHRNRFLRAIARFVRQAQHAISGRGSDTSQGASDSVAQLMKSYFAYDLHRQKGEGLQVMLVVRDAHIRPQSSAFIRLIAPLTSSALAGRVSITLAPQNTTEVPSNIDVCIVQRVAFDTTNAAQTFLKNLRTADARLIVDVDDAFGSIDKSHPEYQEHHRRVDALKTMVAAADQLWCSTRPLAASYAGVRNVRVVPNSLDPRLWRETTRQSRGYSGGPLKLLYMGTPTHNADFATILPALDAAAEKHPGSFELTVVGVGKDLPARPYLKTLRPPYSVYPKFVQWLVQQGPFDFGLCPLADTQFNKEKSDIKCLDYIAMGVVPIVSELEPYQTPGLQKFIVRVPTPAAWANVLEELTRDTVKTRRRYANTAAAQEYLWHERSSEATGQRLLDYMQEVLRRA